MRATVVLLLLTVTGSATAQSVRVTVIDATRRAPVAGAIMSLIDSAGQVARRGLSDERGHLTLRAPHGGGYRLRSARIGFRGIESEPFQVPSVGAIDLEVVMPDEPVVLAELTVSAKAGCVSDPSTAASTAALWTEIRKALDATAISKETGLSFTMALWRRELTANMELRFEESDTIETSVPRPFVAVDPAALVAQGYVLPGENGSTYYGPDEAVLLSPGFLATHCFHLNRRVVAGRNQLGLRFEPERGRRLPDIAGTMWVDTDRGTLTEVDYRYRNVGPEERLGGTATGRVEFLSLPEGWWVVSSWRIRMPRLQEIRVLGRGLENEPIDRRRIVQGYFEDGGSLVAVKGPPGGFATTPSRPHDGRQAAQSDRGVGSR